MIRVPLTPGVNDVLLDLQAIYNQAYDTGPYLRRVDYRADPLIRLEEIDAEWTYELLHTNGLR